MAAEAEAAREARAKVIQAKGEQKAAHNLRSAGETIHESSAALHLRYLQVRAGDCLGDQRAQVRLYPTISVDG